MFFIIYIIFIILFVKLAISSNITDGRIYGKKFKKKISVIEDAIRHNGDKPLVFSNRGKTFTLTVEKGEVSEGLQYSTMPFYTYKNIFLNGELVCRLHKIEATFVRRFLVEYSAKRKDSELDELVKCAYKEAKRIEKAYWSSCSFSALEENKSFYK